MKARAGIVRRVAIGLLAIGAVLTTGACAAGQLAASSQETPAIDGTTGHLGTMQLHAVAITAPDGPCVLPGGDAALSFVLVNTGRQSDSLVGVSSSRFTSSTTVESPDQLASFTSADAGHGSCASASASAAPTSGTSAPSSLAPLTPQPQPQTVAAGQSLPLGVYNAGTNAPGVPTAPIVLLRGLKDGPLYPGTTISVTFSFASAGQIELQVPVQVSNAPRQSFVPSVPVTVSPPGE